jgi:hypothetical protein
MCGRNPEESQVRSKICQSGGWSFGSESIGDVIEERIRSMGMGEYCTVAGLAGEEFAYRGRFMSRWKKFKLSYEYLRGRQSRAIDQPIRNIGV